MEVYQASIQDLEGVSRIFDLYRTFYNQTSDLEGARIFLKERLLNKESVIFVATVNKEYVGFTQLYPTFSSISMKRAWILNDLYVDEKARGQGVGERLLQMAKEHGMQTGANSISLSTAFDNYTAQKLYEKNQYKRDEQFFQYELSLRKV